MRGNPRMPKAGKTLNYNTSDAVTQRGLDAVRPVEWNKRKEFNAGELIRGELLNELLREGHKLIPTDWVEPDKNAHLQKMGKSIKADFKSRLVAGGQFEDATELRTDFPTCELECLNLIMSFAACHKYRFKCGDIRNAYSQGKEIDRVLLLESPKGGLPGIGDSGRRFWKRLREEFLKAGFQANRVSKALYSFQKDGVVKCMVGDHVGDIL